MKKSKINEVWHQEHRIPAGATLEQRLIWHLEHSKNCGCRPIPIKVAKEIKKKGIFTHNTMTKRVTPKTHRAP